MLGSLVDILCSKVPVSRYCIPTSDICNISVTPLFADTGHLLIRELNDSECAYSVLDTSGGIQTFDLLYGWS